jgi:RNA polymerase sigma factor (sigma-70 family)
LNFRERNDVDLARLGDEELVAYLVEARRAGRTEAAVTAAQVLALRYEPRIRGFVANRLGSKGAAVVDDVAERTLTDAIASAAGFGGESVKEFGAWIFRIARRRIVDYHRKGRVDEIPLEVETKEGETVERVIKTGDPTRVIDHASVINQALGEQNDAHREATVLVRFRGYAHKEAADEVNRQFKGKLNDPMTEQNVSQINSRFGKRLDELLDEAEEPPPVDDDDG